MTEPPYEPPYEQLRAVTPFASVLLQHNPGPMTLDGTNTWLLRAPAAPARTMSVIIDPGETSDEHLAAVLAAAPDAALVLITHRHHDHVGVAAELHERTGLPVRAIDPAHCHGAAPLRDGERLTVAGLLIDVLATPGHTSDSACFVVRDAEPATDPVVLTGDTILGRGTTVVAHPDGALGPYLASLARLQALGDLGVLPGHGPQLSSVAVTAAQYLAHREQRLDQVRAALSRLGANASAQQIVEDVYADVDRSVWWAAELSVQAQLDYLRG